MALQNDPRLFTGGNERIDLRPHVQLYAQLMQRKQAKEDALDQYYQNLHKSVNPAGMRTKDIEGGWSQKLNDFTTFGIENKKSISNPKTPEDRVLANRFMSMYQDLQMDTSKSKEAAAMEMELAKQKISGKWNPTQDDLDVASSIGSSIYDPKYYKDPDIRTKPYSLADLSLNIPQVTPKEQEEYYKAAVGNLKPKEKYDETKARRDNVTGQVFVPFQASYETDQVKKIAENAGVLFPGNRTPIGVHYEKLLHDPKFFEEANAAFQSVYGPDAVVDTPKKAAQAAAIINTMADVSTGEKPFKDENLAYDKQKAMAKYTQDRIDARQRRQQDFTIARENYRNSKNATIVDEYVQSQYNDPDAKPGWVTNDGKKYEGKFVKAPKFLIDKYSINEGTKDAPKWNDPKFFISDDGKYVFPVYKYKDDKRPTGAFGVSTDTKPINMADWKIEISNDWIKNNRTANELSDEFDVEGEVDESRSSTKMQKTSTPSYSNEQPATYKGQKITVGIKNGKWYNTKTGEEIK